MSTDNRVQPTAARSCPWEMAMVRLEPSKGPPAAHPRPSPNSWRADIRAHAVVRLTLRCSRRNEAVDHFNGARERVLSTRTPCLWAGSVPARLPPPSSRPVCPWRACTCLAGRGLGPPLLGDRRPLAKLLTLPVERAVEPAPVPRVHQLSQRLSEETVAALVSDYRSGASLDDLQRSYLLRPVAPDFEGSCTAWAG